MESAWKCEHCKFHTDDTDQAIRHSYAYGHKVNATGYKGVMEGFSVEAE